MSKNFSPISIICSECGQEFIFSVDEQIYFAANSLATPKRCKNCRKNRRIKKETAESKKAEEEKRRQEIIDEAEIARIIKENKINQVGIDKLTVSESQKTLFILGNGFDIMHGAHSSYWDFQKTLGKHNELRFHLENYLKVAPDKLWYNFEESLSHIDAGVMLDVVDMWLDIFDVYRNNAESAADFQAAIDTAMLPIQVICHKLPKRFRQWVETLTPDGKKPFKKLISTDSLYLNFNYTEFLESLYDIPAKQIVYIHGCRKKEKFKPKDNLILGHTADIDYLKDYKPAKGMVPKYKNRIKRNILEIAMENTIDLWVNYYEETFTKHTPEIIADNTDFFKKAFSISDIIVIGHSLSEVDYPYFLEINKYNQNKAYWHIGYHSLNDLKNIIKFIEVMNISSDKFEIYRK